MALLYLMIAPSQQVPLILVDENNNTRTNWLGYSFNDKEIYNDNMIANNIDCYIFTKINSKIITQVTGWDMDTQYIDDSTTFFTPNFSFAKIKTVNGIKTTLNSQLLVDLSGYYLVNISGYLKLDKGITPNLNITVGLLCKKFGSSLADVPLYYITSFITTGKNQIIPINFNYYLYSPFQVIFGFIHDNTETFFNKNDRELINYDLTFKVYFKQYSASSYNDTNNTINN